MGSCFYSLQCRQVQDLPSTSAEEERHPLGGTSTIGWHYDIDGAGATNSGDGVCRRIAGGERAGGVCDGRGVASHDHGADIDGSADGLIVCAGGADGACVRDSYDGGGSASCNRTDTGGGGDARDGCVVAWCDRDTAGGGDAARPTDGTSDSVRGRANGRGHG
jgi:hypothetical protein